MMMKSILAATAAALMSASLLASPVLAQVSVGAGADVGAGAGGVGVGASTKSETGANVGASGSANAGSSGAGANLDAGTTSAVDGKADFDSALKAINGNADVAGQIGSISDVGSVDVVRISELPDANAEALTSAVSENKAEIDNLKSAIESNSAVSGALEAQSVEPADVVAAKVEADGKLTVFVR